MKPSLLLFTLLFTNVVHAVEVSFQDLFYLRSKPSFAASDTASVVGTIGTGGKAVLLESKKTPGGNLAIKIRVTSGRHSGKETWVYYDLKRPNITITENGRKLSAAEIALFKASNASNGSPSHQPTVPPPKRTIEASVECENCNQPSQPPFNDIDRTLQNSFSPAFLGAMKTMAVMYQSCESIQKPPYSYQSSIDNLLSYRTARGNMGHSYKIRTIPKGKITQLIDRHYYLDKNGPDNGQCRDMRKAPPLYTYGGWPSINGASIDILKQHNTSGAPFTGLDCSSFISTAMSAAGLALTPYSKVSTNTATSTEYASFTQRNSCFKPPMFTTSETLKSGDILAWSGHVFMIDKVGQDPFGIEKMNRAGVRLSSIRDCEKIPSDFSKYLNFDIVQSAGLGSLSISRVPARQYISMSGLIGKIRPLAIAACKSKLTGGVYPLPANKAANLLRHKGSSHPGCLMPRKATLTGEQCVARCT